ncbi:fluoride efflux transporter CrcB [Streptomyces pseudovenezuelae]|uniref:Fluoride-specific ion channel FluC n=1 Tax=Streptomyces pseudovenezuelae TaxID=67350 RepID=A0ABT6LRN7_9ACTN|nr:fluoride efflux transporter CrcB [Streptomyces pseudovenezuelae]MDH6218993.1 CrcB protein [Streptomyces pseudovenezuelae]
MTAPEAESLRTRPATARRPDWRGQTPIVAVVALGGAIGAVARYGLALGVPAGSGGFPWATFWTNVIGCAVMGAFMVLVTEIRSAHRFVRPFFGTGVLGGFTTFSTYAIDIQKLVDAGHPRTGLAYLAATLLAALTAVWLAATVTRRVLKWRRKPSTSDTKGKKSL